MVQKRGRAVINLNIHRNDFFLSSNGNFYMLIYLHLHACKRLVNIPLSFSIRKGDDYGLESGLIMRKGFLDHSHVPDGKFRISTKMFLLSVVLSF